MLELFTDLCRYTTGSRCTVPRWSSWRLVAPSTSSVSVDAFDVVTGGAGAVVPLNVKGYGSLVELGLTGGPSKTTAKVTGYGAGIGVGAGWGIPFVGAKNLSKMPDGVKKEIAKRLGGAGQSKAIDMVMSAIDTTARSAGTRLVCGPNAPAGDLTVNDFFGVATIVSLGANAVVNGVSVGVVIFGNKPVVRMSDLIHAKAFGLIGTTGAATSLDVEISNIVYKTSVTN